MEVERKFRPEAAPELGGTSSERIEQGYLALGSDGEVRLRRIGEHILLTVKRGSGLSRREAEVELDPERFEALWPLTEGRRLSKRRHRVPLSEHEVEVDVYGGELEGLVLAEIEFPDEESARGFQPPGWLGEEVTGERRYLNETLATRGSP